MRRVRMLSRGMDQLLKSEKTRALIRPYTLAVEARAVGSAVRDTGEYAASIGIEADVTDRVVDRVVARAPHSLIVEAETGNLQRALGG